MLKQVQHDTESHPNLVPGSRLYPDPINYSQTSFEFWAGKETIDKVQSIIACHYGIGEAPVFLQLHMIMYVVGINGPFS